MFHSLIFFSSFMFLLDGNRSPISIHALSPAKGEEKNENNPERLRSRIRLTLVVLFSISPLFAFPGENRKNELPDHLRRSFPTGAKLEKVGDVCDCSRKCEVTAVIDVKEQTVGYAIRQNLSSRSGKFTASVAIDRDVRIIHVEVLSYSGKRGSAVRSAGFTKQFAGKSGEEPMQVGRDIDAVAGATMSCEELTDGVRHALRFAQKIIPKPKIERNQAGEERERSAENMAKQEPSVERVGESDG